MKQVQFFSNINIAALQLQVNEWLALNRNISILETNMVVAVLDNTEHFSFYILYGIRGQKAKGPAAILAEELREPVRSTEIGSTAYQLPN